MMIENKFNFDELKRSHERIVIYVPVINGDKIMLSTLIIN